MALGDDQNPPAGRIGDGEEERGPTNAGPTAITKQDVKDMGGSLKVHIRLNLEVDVRVIAKIKGDIAIGIL